MSILDAENPICSPATAARLRHLWTDPTPPGYQINQQDQANDLGPACSIADSILEGLTCTRAAIADRLAYRIWVEAPDDVRLRRGLERDGDTHRDLWLGSMTTERQFFTDDATRTRADLRVNGHPDISHDEESEVVLLD